MIVYVVNATLVSVNWRWNWFSFQRFHSLPQNFMLDCQCSEMHGLWRVSEMMCVTWHIKMWELELRGFGGETAPCVSVAASGQTRTVSSALSICDTLKKQTLVPSQLIHSTTNFPCQKALGDVSLLLASTCPELLREGRSQRRGSTDLEKLGI